MPHRKARTADIEQRLLIDAIYHRYHYDFRGYAQASLKRRLASALVQFDCKTLSQLQDRVLHEPAVFPALLEYLTVQVSDMFRDPTYFRSLRTEVVPLLRTYPSLKVWVAGLAATVLVLYPMGKSASFVHGQGLRKPEDDKIVGTVR